jgi:hypothetical protein
MFVPPWTSYILFLLDSVGTITQPDWQPLP